MTDRQDQLAAVYDAVRPRLVRIAYAILGSHAEAEDVVADCWMRLVEADRREAVVDVEAWSTVVVSRAALDTLRSARRRREEYVGPWLPEPVVERVDVAAIDPADRVTLDEQVSFALLVVLESLSPAERTVWVLHDLFGMPFPEVAATVGRTPTAVRQLASRARAHVAAGAPRVTVTPAQHDSAVRGFLSAALDGDMAACLAALDPDVVLTSDGGGKVSAARRPIVGADKVVRFLFGILATRVAADELTLITVNGRLAVAAVRDGRVDSVISLTLDGDRVTRVDIVRAPDKLPAP
ncbi:RNA polymerase sigma factor SigJ [uncultured Williamsia sp.]|uniref:RNA polymerase sigma factor SigJ n=1 Tax=uncultured Williamsia sp. TaxID=259311 RepID=UPI0026317C04|nr:RNA polymerase sigma factor SigJ [uncultured Williamsia sp.]